MGAGLGGLRQHVAGLIVMAILCSSLISLLFWVRDHLLAWQKGLLRW